jgi:hypothetical protein
MQFLEPSIRFLVYVEKKTPKVQFLSVGSGLGIREALLQQYIHRQIVCIDPRPKSFQTNETKLAEIKPHFPTVQDWKHDSKEIGNPVAVLLFHPYPTEDLYPEAGYDYEAIQLLKPQWVHIMVAPGNSGSQHLWKWIDHNKCHPARNYRLMQEKKLAFPDPKLQALVYLSFYRIK